MRTPLVLGATLLAATTAHADATLEYQVRGADLSGSQTIHIAGDRLRLSVDEGGRENVMLYNAAGDTLHMLDTQSRSYVEMDADTAAQMRQGLKDMEAQLRAQMEAQMEGLSAEERQAMEQMMGQMLGQTNQAPPQWRVERTGQSETVNDFDCEVVKLYRNDVLEQELCVAERQTLNLSENEFNTVQGMFRLLQSMGGEQAPDLSRLDGLPVRAREQTEAGDRVAELQAVKDTSLDPALFQVPEGYTAETPFSKP